MTQYKIYTEADFDSWFEEQTFKSKRQVFSRLSKIEEYGHFGHVKNLDENGDDLHELKFNDGRRIYYVVIPVDNVILLLGGNKNGQNSDIKKARKLIAKAQDKAKDRGF